MVQLLNYICQFLANLLVFTEVVQPSSHAPLRDWSFDVEICEGLPPEKSYCLSPVTWNTNCVSCRRQRLLAPNSLLKASEWWHCTLTERKKMITLRLIRTTWLSSRSSRTCGGVENSTAVWDGFLSLTLNFLEELAEPQNRASKCDCYENETSHLVAFQLSCSWYR